MKNVDMEWLLAAIEAWAEERDSDRACEILEMLAEDLDIGEEES